MLQKLRLLFAAAFIATALPARAQTPLQNPQILMRTAESFLLAQVAAWPGKPVVSVKAPAHGAALPACDSITPFLPGGARLRPRLSVGLRCASPAAWTVYLQAAISVPGRYYVAAHTLHPGDTLKAESLAERNGDLITLPAGVVTRTSSVVGQIVGQRIAAGQVVRANALRSANAVQRGQTVRILARGTGFQISNEGLAMGSGAPGKPVPVRTASGQILTAIVRDAQTVEVPL